MRMDPNLSFFSDYSTNSFIDEITIFSDTENGFKLDSPPFDSNFMNVPFDPPDSDSNELGLSFESFEPSPSWSPEGDSSSPSNDSDSSDPVLKYITQMLLEENMENKPPMFYDPLALKATEKSLYDVLGEQDPNSWLKSSRPYVDYESPDSNHSGNGSDYAGNSSTSIITGATIATDNFVDPWQVVDPAEYGLKSNMQPTVEFSVNPSNGLPNSGNDIVGTSASKMVQNMFTDSDSILQFNRGLEEASKFLPKPAQLVIDLESYSISNGPKKETALLAVKEEKIERPISPEDGPRSRKNHNRDDSDSDSEQGRSSKQTAVCVDESDEISEVFDKVLLWPGLKGTTDMCCGSQVKQNNVPKANDQSNGSTGGKGRAKKSVKKKETVDLRSLLILCAQAVSGNDFRTANELLKQIRQHSSPKGDGSQRLAHCFANGLEARLVGSGAGLPNLYTSLASKRTTAADILNAYRTHLHCCPFKKLSIIFANKMILHAAEKSKTLHIIDFGVLYGFQWPILIQYLSMREGGPPKLRITGIELPQRGFRPTERIEETGRRLARYCERFHVPFEYNPIAAQNWESIPIEDLKIRTDEVLAVNSMGRFKNLHDETVEVDCPRNAVLGLIRKINPNIFVHTIINGSYNAPFFVTRFREALFHFSAMFDMFDSALPREDEGRMMLENEMYGREAINVVACEGVERVERPETYKQWQVRTTRAGFKQLPLDQGTMEKCGGKLKCYNKDFVLDVDNNWMLQGWKGRIIYASSCWVPA